MSDRGYKIRDQEAIHFITFAVVEWVDVFTRPQYNDIVIKSLKHCQEKKGLRVHAYVIMSNHVHFVLSVEKGFRLSDVLRDFKKFTSSRILQSIEGNKQESRSEWMLALFSKAGKENSRNTSYQFWRQDNQPKELTNNKMTDQKIEYIHNNPIFAGIVENNFDYIYSSAKNYAGMKGLIEIDIL